MIPVLNGISYIEPELTELEENTNYNFTLRANTIVGDGPFTTSQVLTLEDGECSLTCTYIKSSSMSWV